MLPNSKEEKECKRCTLHTRQDVEHCLWGCIKAERIWQWVSFLAQLTSQDPDQMVGLTLCKALVGVGLDFSPEIPLKWWTALHTTTLWNIWLDRNAEVRQNNGSMQRTKARISYQMRISLKSEWSKLTKQIREGRMTNDQAQYKFLFEFGLHAKVCNFDIGELAINRIPPEPN